MEKQNNDIDFDLLAKFFAGEASSLEIEQILAWRDSSAANKAEFHRIETIWDESIKLEISKNGSQEVDAAWKKVVAKIQSDGLKSKKVVRWKFFDSFSQSILYKVAAAVLFGFSIYFLTQLFENNEITLQVSEQQLQQLPDSSIITLRPDAKLVYAEAFDGKTREVKLNGSAFFEITKNPERPFIIDLDEVKVVVLGTSFYIDAMENTDEIEVGVESGLVAVINTAKNDTVRLAREDKVIFQRSTGQFKVVERVDINSIFWKTNTLIFKNENLSEVINTLEEKYKVSIGVTDEAILNCRVSGRFKDETVANILAKLALSFGWEVEQKGGFVLKGKGC